jgi:lipoic acid synthetase
MDALQIVMKAKPDVLYHNVEIVPSLSRTVQPQARYEWSLVRLKNAKYLDPTVLTKSGLMVGLGEGIDEVESLMQDLASLKVDILTIG